MGAMYEKGQTKRYSRVASFKNGKEVKRPKKSAALRWYERETRKNMTEPERTEYQELKAMRESNKAEAGKDMARNAMRLIGMKKGGGVGSSMQSAGERIMRGLKPTIDEVVKRRPAMKHGGKVSRYGGGGGTESEDNQEPRPARPKSDKMPRPKPRPVRNKKEKEKEKATKKKGGLFGGYKTRQEQLEAQMAEMKTGGKVESKKMIRKMAVGGAPKPEAMSPAGGRVTPDFLRQLKAFESRQRTQARPRPGRGDSSMPFKSDKMPRPRPGRKGSMDSQNKSGVIVNSGPKRSSKSKPMPRPKPRPKRSSKSKPMPRPKPRSSMSAAMRNAGLDDSRYRTGQNKMPRPKPRPSSAKSGQMPKPRPKPRPGMPRPPLTPRPGREDSMFGLKQRKAGGAVKTKKYAAGGMIPSAGKKSPSSMGTPYRAGGSIKPKKYSGGGGIGGGIDGCAIKGRTRGRTK